MRKWSLLLMWTLWSQAAQAEGLAAWLVSIQTMISSMKAMTMQQNLSAEKRDAMRVQSTQAEASAAVERYNMGKVRQAYEDYGPNGQLTDPCYQLHLSEKSGAVVSKVSTSSQDAAALVYRTGLDGYRSSAGVSGLLGGKSKATNIPFSMQVAEKDARHRGKYCSVSESKAGYCQLSPTGMQSGDSDFSVHLVPGKTFGWDQTEAATDFIKNVAPVKVQTVEVDSRKCNDPVCLETARNQQRQEPMMSMARYSFIRFVESRTTQSAGEAKQPAGK